MRPFEHYHNHAARMNELRDEQWRIERDRRRLRERRRMENLAYVCWCTMWLTIFLGAVLMAIYPSGLAAEPEVAKPEATVLYPTQLASAPEIPALPDVEAAEPVELQFLRDDIPLDYDTQSLLKAAADEAGIDFELAVAVVWRESAFRNVTGDEGQSLGYMQVQPRWHADRMARLGVTDLMDPAGNFRVGCDYLAELLARWGDTHKALMAYNMGESRAISLWSTGIVTSRYSCEITNYMEELK